MRAVAEETLGQNLAFVSLNGRAEAIPLAEHTVDIVTVGQALHWFEVEQARTEFLRILRSGGWIVVVDMFTRDEETDFMRACAMVRQANFADIGRAADPPLRVVRLFEGLKPVKKVIPHIFLCNEQVFRDGFLSSSLAPEFGTKAYQRVAENIGEIFDTYQIDGLVRLEFETIVWSAHVDFC
jgi:SAM-dependent methyltransferase